MFECLKRWFSKKPKTQGVLIIGHRESKPGAIVVGYDNEYMYNSKVGHLVKDKIPAIEVSFYNEIEKDFVVLSDPGFISIELHCNAFNKTTSGAEVLALEDDLASIDYAEEILFEICERFDKRNRGVKILKEGERGYKNLLKAKRRGAKVAIIVEPFFGDNPDDVIDAEEYAQFLVDWFNDEEGK